MQRYFFIVLCALSMTVNAQKIESVKATTPMNDGGKLELSYSYYLNSEGQQVLHGAFRAKSTQVESKSGTTGTKLIECTFLNGEVDGRFHYEVHTKGYVGERVMTPFGIVIEVKHKPGLDVNENITFNTHQGYMTGDIDFTTKMYGTPRTFHGKSQDGIVVDGTDFVCVIGGYGEEVYRNYKPLPTVHANLKSVSSQESKLYFDVTYLDEQLQPCVYLPRYVWKNLEDYPDYIEALQYKNSDPAKYVAGLESLPRKELSHEDADSISSLINAYWAEQRAKEAEARRKAAEEKANYKQACETYIALHKKCSALASPISPIRPYIVDRSVDKGFIPICVDEHVENITINKYSMVMRDAVAYFAATRDHKPVSTTSAGVEEEIAKFPWESYLPILNKCGTIMWQQSKIELFYTKTTTRSFGVENLSRERCEKKIAQKKPLYNAYCAVAEYLDAQITDQTTPEEYSLILDTLAAVSQKLFDCISADTKDLEKAVKKAKSAEEVIMILTQS